MACTDAGTCPCHQCQWCHARSWKVHCLCSSASFTCSATCISLRICNTSLHYVTFLQCAVLDNAGYSVEKCWRFCLLLIRGWTYQCALAVCSTVLRGVEDSACSWYEFGLIIEEVQCMVLSVRFCSVEDSACSQYLFSVHCAGYSVEGFKRFCLLLYTRLDLSSRKCSVWCVVSTVQRILQCWRFCLLLIRVWTPNMQPPQRSRGQNLHLGQHTEDLWKMCLWKVLIQRNTVKGNQTNTPRTFGWPTSIKV